jgi:hypothetical protein
VGAGPEAIIHGDGRLVLWCNHLVTKWIDNGLRPGAAAGQVGTQISPIWMKEAVSS